MSITVLFRVYYAEGLVMHGYAKGTEVNNIVNDLRKAIVDYEGDFEELQNMRSDESDQIYIKYANPEQEWVIYAGKDANDRVMLMTMEEVLFASFA